MTHEKAARPEDLGRFIVERLNAGDVDGIVALYEPDAVLSLPGGRIAHGSTEIRVAYTQIVAAGKTFAPGTPLPALHNGDLALTATRLPCGGATAEVARRQPDGSWLWVIDEPSLVR